MNKRLFLLGLFISAIFFAGFGTANAWSKGCAEEIGTPQENECKDDLHGRNFIEKGLVIPGKVTRELEEFNLRVMYYSRPYKERSLSFSEWSDLYGYNTYGAGPIPHGDFSLPDASEFGQVGSNTDLKGFILNVTNWVLSFLGLICVVMIIYAGYLYIITGGEDGHEKGKKIIMYVAIGIILILVSYALVNTIIKSTTEGGDNFEGIAAISKDLIEGSIDISSENGVSISNYGSGYIVPDAVDVDFTAESNDGSEPYDLRWSFGDGTIINTDSNTFSRSFFEQGKFNIIVIGKIDQSVHKDLNGDGEDDIVTYDYMAKVNILVGSSAFSIFDMSVGQPKKNEQIHFDAKNSRATVGVIKEYIWECSSSTNEGICDGFIIDNNKKDFYFSFQDSGEVTITLILRTNVEEEAGVFSKTFNVLEEGDSMVSGDEIKARFQAKLNPSVGENIKFIGSVLPADIIADNYEWECVPMGSSSENICTNFNNNASGNDKVFYAQFPEEGSVKISLIVKKGEGEEEIESEKFEKLLQVEAASVNNTSIDARFQVSRISPKVGENVRFIGMILPAGLIADQYNWSCEEMYSSGSPIPEENICNEFNQNSGFKKIFNTSFSKAGTVKISLVVKKDEKSSEVFEKLIQVEEADPIQEDKIESKFNVSKTNLKVDESARFTGIILPTGLIADKYNWGCEGLYSSGKSICDNFNSDNRDNPLFYTSFASPGTVRIFLTVTKNDIESEIFEKLLYIEEGMMKNVIDFNSSSNIRSGEVATFSVTNINKEYKSFEWEISNLLGESLAQGLEGEIVNVLLEDVGEYSVTLMAKNDKEESVDITKQILVTEKGSPVPALKINGKNVFSNDLIELNIGEEIEMDLLSVDSNGNSGENADIDHSWVLNGSIVNQEEILNISKKEGLYSLKLNAISTNNSNNRNSLYFKMKINSEKADVDFKVEKNDFLGSGFYEMDAKVNTENINIKSYKFEVLELGKKISTQLINSSEKEIKVVADVSDNVGKHEYVFQVTVTEENGASTIKHINKSVEIKEEENLNNPPTVEIFVTPSTVGTSDELFHFYLQSNDIDNDFLTYKWEFPNGKKVVGKTANHKFLEEGDNEVKVTVSDGLEEVSSTETITITKSGNNSLGNNSPQIISSGISPGNTGDTETMFRFYASAEDKDEDELNYTWIMGDGNEISLKNVTYQYQFPGKYVVKLKISDGQKNVTKSIPVIIVKKGEPIPESTEGDYEEHNDLGDLSDLSAGDISIGNTVENNNLGEFSDQVDEALKLKSKELDRKKANDMEKIIDNLRDEYNSTKDPERKQEILKEMKEMREELATINKSLPSEEDLELDIGRLKDEYNSTKDPKLKKEILDKINAKKIDLDKLRLGSLSDEIDALREKFNNEESTEKKEEVLEQRIQKRKELAKLKISNPELKILENKDQEKLESEIDVLFNEYKNTTDPIRKEEILKEIKSKQLEISKMKESERENPEEEIRLAKQIKDLLTAYKNTDDPELKKKILNAINQKRIELESLDENLSFKFVGLEGTVNTKFFFYSKIPKSNKPILIKWETGDERTFIGPNVSWKYLKPGNYVVKMEVSDGIVMATDSINIQIK